MAKPDDRSDNVEKIQEMVQNTIENMEEARETLRNHDMPDDQRSSIMSKNHRREESIRSYRRELKDESSDAGK